MGRRAQTNTDTIEPRSLIRKREAGRRAYLSGDSAERSVIADYQRHACNVLETRWRGQAGEIDLIVRDGATYVFCEVKKARRFDIAMSRLRPAQMRRIYSAAEEYLGTVPEGLLAEVRFDLALVDERGAIEIVQNAFGHF